MTIIVNYEYISFVESMQFFAPFYAFLSDREKKKKKKKLKLTNVSSAKYGSHSNSIWSNDDYMPDHSVYTQQNHMHGVHWEGVYRLGYKRVSAWEVRNEDVQQRDWKRKANYFV